MIRKPHRSSCANKPEHQKLMKIWWFFEPPFLIDFLIDLGGIWPPKILPKPLRNRQKIDEKSMLKTKAKKWGKMSAKSAQDPLLGLSWTPSGALRALKIEPKSTLEGCKSPSRKHSQCKHPKKRPKNCPRDAKDPQNPSQNPPQNPPKPSPNR